MNARGNGADGGGSGDRAARLADALRANLRRRKQQARAQADAPVAEAPLAEAPFAQAISTDAPPGPALVKGPAAPSRS